jgi:hypothetical protein
MRSENSLAVIYVSPSMFMDEAFMDETFICMDET